MGQKYPHVLNLPKPPFWKLIPCHLGPAGAVADPRNEKMYSDEKLFLAVKSVEKSGYRDRLSAPERVMILSQYSITLS